VRLRSCRLWDLTKERWQEIPESPVDGRVSIADACLMAFFATGWPSGG